PRPLGRTMSRWTAPPRRRRREPLPLLSSALLLTPLLLGASCDPRECAEDGTPLLLTAPAGATASPGQGLPLKVNAFGNGVVFLRVDKGLLVDSAGEFVTRCLPVGELSTSLCDQRDGGGACDENPSLDKVEDAGDSERLFESSPGCLGQD